MKCFPKPAIGILVIAVALLIPTTATAQHVVTDWNAIAISGKH